MAKMEYNDFYCLNCGNKYTLPRKSNRRKESMHRKVLYCPFCGKDVNHIEIKTYEEKELFLENFKNGVYLEECQASLAYIGGIK